MYHASRKLRTIHIEKQKYSSTFESNRKNSRELIEGTEHGIRANFRDLEQDRDGSDSKSIFFGKSGKVANYEKSEKTCFFDARAAILMELRAMEDATS